MDGPTRSVTSPRAWAGPTLLRNSLFFCEQPEPSRFVTSCASVRPAKGSIFMTKAMFTGLLAGLAVALAAGLPARAAEPDKAEAKASQPYVVLIGISDYADKQINSRAHAEDDAEALYDLLTNKEYLGADADHVKLLLGKEDKDRHSEPATKENI